MNKKILFSICIINFLLIGFSQLAFGQILVDPMILNFTKNTPIAQNVLVQNGGSQTDYVSVTPYLVTHPGTKSEKQIRIYDPQKLGILVYPNRLVIPPHQQDYVRIMLTKPLGQKDRIYRITFIPKIAGLITSKTSHGKSIGLHIIVGYGILVNVRPVDAEPKLTFSKENHTLTITNIGNSNILITKLEQCKTHHQCVYLGGNRLYAGNTWHIHVPENAPITLDTEWNENYKTYQIP